MKSTLLLHIVFYPLIFIFGMMVGEKIEHNSSCESRDIGWAKARAQYEKEAKEGFAESQYYFGLYILEGKGDIPNPEKGFDWIKKSAENGYIQAQFKLASMYEHGIGTSKDQMKAFEFYKKAAENAANHLKKKLTK